MTGQDDGKEVMSAIVDYIFQCHRFPSCTQILEATKISKANCLKICEELVRAKQLYIVFEGEGLPTVYVPYDMMQDLLMTQRKPKWVSNYSFTDEPTLSSKAEVLQNELVIYDLFKRLLYATDFALEEAVAFALSWLEFKDVIHNKVNTDNPDVTFEHNGTKALVEIEGTTKAGGKDKVLQLEGWVKRELDAGRKSAEIEGFYIINHFRELEPASRGEPLGNHAREYLKRYQFKYLAAPSLFTIVKSVKEGALTKKDARATVWQGDSIA